MFKNIIVRRPCKGLVEGITTANLGKPDYELALKQHDKYIETLRECGVNVTVLEANEEFPDSCFVEDVALCTRKCAIVTRPGALSRRNEILQRDMQEALENFYENVEYIKEPGTVEAGDIMMVGDHFYIGLSARTNEEGAKQIIEILRKYSLDGSVVPLKEVLHLKTGLSYIENNNLLVAGEFVTSPIFKEFNKIIINDDENYSANCIWVNDAVIVPAGYPTTKKAIEDAGYEVKEVDTSEYRKIDGGLSCLSLRF
ncbi:dimethylarginine dimethylaminohydrolase [Clostridium subterminale]|uniref:Dimethylarginine dimethylaminohydrolase n=1 Tax=Clostridium subterminale TaxID=1550 RepID=A0ABP3VVZ7_CLOSU